MTSNSTNGSQSRYETNEDRLRAILNRHWPAWTLAEEIGKGSYATVYRVHRKELDEYVEAAIKHISIPRDDQELRDLRRNQGLTHSDEVRDYYNGYINDKRREISLYRALRVTNVIGYEDHAIISREGAPGYDILIRMELLTSLPDYLDTEPLTERDAVLIGVDMLTALEECQQRGIIHRDVKPANMFVKQERGARPVYKLGDFGVGRQQGSSASRFGTIAGTPIYMAPEVYRGGEGYKHDVDQYALGLALYELLNRRRLPFEPPRLTSKARDDAFDRRVKGEAIPPPEFGGSALFHALSRACAYAPEDRYAIASDMKRDLLAVLEREPLDQPLGLSVSERGSVSQGDGRGQSRGNSAASGGQPEQQHLKSPVSTPVQEEVNKESLHVPSVLPRGDAMESMPEPDASAKPDLSAADMRPSPKEPENTQETIYIDAQPPRADRRNDSPPAVSVHRPSAAPVQKTRSARRFVIAGIALAMIGVAAIFLFLRGKTQLAPTVTVEAVSQSTATLSLSDAFLQQSGKASYSLVYGPATSGVQPQREASPDGQSRITLENLAPNTAYRIYAVWDGARQPVADFVTEEAPQHPALRIPQSGAEESGNDALLAFAKHAVSMPFEEASTAAPYRFGVLSHGDGSFNAQGSAAFVKFTLLNSAAPLQPHNFLVVLRFGQDTYAWRHDNFADSPSDAAETVAIPIHGLLDALYAANGNRWPSEPLTLSVYADGQLVGHGALVLTE